MGLQIYKRSNKAFCSVLFCSVLFCSVLFCSVLFCSVLFCSVLFCSVLFCSVLFCSVLFCSVLFCSVLFCSVLFCSDRNCKMRIYDSFFLSNFNYCPLIYSMQNRRNDKKIETLNKRMLRIVCNDRISSYNELLSTVNRPMLYCNRKKALIDEVFKVLYGLSPPVSPDFFTKQIITYVLRDNFMLMQPHFRTIQYGFKSIAY